MPYLFDTDAISEMLKPRPAEDYVTWLRGVPQVDQFTSAVVVGELFKGAFRSAAREKWLRRIEDEVLPLLTVLAYDAAVARTYGEIRATLENSGEMPGEADLMIAATALTHGLTVVTGNLRHFQRVPGLATVDALARARARNESAAHLAALGGSAPRARKPKR